MPEMKVWDGTAFVDGEPRIWNGSSFVAPSEAYVWQGGQFVKVWPTWTFSVTLVGTNTGTGSSISIPSHQAGDLILISRSGGSQNASTPAGWTDLEDTSTNFGGFRHRVAYRIASGPGTTSGTWGGTSSSFDTIVAVYRTSGNGWETPVSASNAVPLSANSTLTYPAVTGSGLVVRMGEAHSGVNNIPPAPSGYTSRATIDLQRLSDSGGQITNPAAESVSLWANGSWSAVTVVICNT